MFRDSIPLSELLPFVPYVKGTGYWGFGADGRGKRGISKPRFCHSLCYCNCCKQYVAKDLSKTEGLKNAKEP